MQRMDIVIVGVMRRRLSARATGRGLSPDQSF
ncbi:hypothetical protein FHT93_007087 [Rhizobium sp. BK379]|nr:hypothetical protein [Rhizobium sp. BK379]